MSEIKIGDKAPNFSLQSDDGKTVSLADYSGKNIILYFYPKDDTPGCTAEAIDFKENLADFTAKNTVIIGVSKDDNAKHQKFKNKYELPFTLLSDIELDLCKKYGAWVEKSMYGKKYMGIERSSFLIDSEGSIKKIWRKVKVKGHVAEVLSAI